MPCPSGLSASLDPENVGQLKEGSAGPGSNRENAMDGEDKSASEASNIEQSADVRTDGNKDLAILSSNLSKSDLSNKNDVKRVLSHEWKAQWQGAVMKAKAAEDPWEIFDIASTYPTERAKRYRYNALKRKWVEDEVLVKMELEPFGRGSLRQCFRMKKLSTLQRVPDWEHASNIVAKRYIEEVAPKVYFSDVMLQMDAKLWGEEYNRRGPPKKVDIIQMSVLKMVDREGAPLYHIEHFIEGKYVKYNSNSGFVLADRNMRLTPQAFSHFTFERSGHQLMVVDIQGVGDLYTDPQIHTARGYDYGEGNLGTKGMALFFASHHCSQICQDLNLEPFDLAQLELQRIDEIGSHSSTSTEVKPHSRDPGRKKISVVFDLQERLGSLSLAAPLSPTGFEEEYDESEEGAILFSVSPPAVNPRRRRATTETSSEAFSSSSEDEEGVNYLDRFFNSHAYKPASVCYNKVTSEVISERLQNIIDLEQVQLSTLGQIHYDMALYNYVGRFTSNEPDMVSAKFHLHQAAVCGHVPANKLLAFKCLGRRLDDFENLELGDDPDAEERVMDYLMVAATGGDQESMIMTARAFDTGENLGRRREISWFEAVRWYEAAINMEDAGDNGYPAYELYVRMAEMYRTGGPDLEKDANRAGELYNSAAEDAMNRCKGKLANTYYMMAEEVWSEVQ